MKKKVNYISIIIFLLVFGFTIYTLLSISIIPTKYIIASISVMLMCFFVLFILNRKKFFIGGTVTAIVLSVIILSADIYATSFVNSMNTLTDIKNSTDSVSFIVCKDDQANELLDTIDYTYGISKTDPSDLCDESIKEIHNRTGASINTVTYKNTVELIDSLYSGEIPIIIFNEALRDTVIEIYPDFEDRTRIIDTFNYESPIVTTDEQGSTAADEDNNSKNSNPNAFTVYISGNDRSGILTANGRSDVNIIATVNPDTRQIVLVSTPRDYWVNINTKKGIRGYEKLTHAGWYGVAGSMATLEELYGINIDYYIKVNFDGAMGVVDELGGITIDSTVEFDRQSNISNKQYHFNIGSNQCDGDKTLAFCRERYAFSDGDNQRGRNQMQALKGIIKKLQSPVIITNYKEIFANINKMVATNIPSDKLAELIRKQLNDNTPWTVQSLSTAGTGSKQTGELFGIKDMYVMIPDMSTVKKASSIMEKVKNGENVTLE